MVLHVDKNHPSASDATTRASNTAETPWATLGRGMWGHANRNTMDGSQCVQPGDTLIVKAYGLSDPYVSAYTDFANDENDIAYRLPSGHNGGTSSDPIVIMTDVVGQCRLTLVGGAGNMVGFIGGNGLTHTDDPSDIPGGYLTWRGFTVDETIDAFSAGWPCLIQAGKFVTIEYCDLGGDLADIPGEGSNHAGVRIERSSDLTIRNNRLRDFIATPQELNGTGIEVYNSLRLTFEHNHITGCGSCIFSKAPAHLGQTQWVGQQIWRFNLVHDCEVAYAVHRQPHTGTGGDYTLVHQNIGRDCHAGFVWFTFNDSTSPKHCYVLSNTFHNLSVEGVTTGNDVNWNTNAANEYFNNICRLASASQRWMTTGIPDAQWTSANFLADRNLFNPATMANFWQGTSNRTFASHQSAFSLNLNSLTSAPDFENEAGDDFRLVANGQAALTRGRARHGIGGADDTEIPLGAYITGSEVIGIEPLESQAAATRHRRRPGGCL